ncbi:MAG: energy-coupling factor ABC transporter permease, partial [Candidatus Bathyarchaeia archaeon]
MAHIHLPDGAFQLQWVIFWFAIASSIIVLLVLKYRRNHYFDINKLSRAAILATFTFAIFQVEAPFFGGLHLSFTPLLGITLGPILGCASILVVNIFSAALGHSGWSILGANFLINSIEVTISYALFLLFEKFTKSSFA